MQHFDVLGICITISVHATDRCVRDCTYRRGLGVACSDLRAIPEPHVAEQQQCSPAFLYMYINRNTTNTTNKLTTINHLKFKIMRKILCLMLVLLGTVMLSAKNVSVTVFPETATVMQKGKVIQPVTPGVYSLTVSIVDLVFVAQADGYDSQQFIINLKSPSTMQVHLKPNRKQVSISSEPNTATIYVDGREMGKGIVDFSINKYETKTIKVEQDGYDTYIKQVAFNDQSDINMSYNINLVQNRRDVNLLVDAPAAEFYADGLLIGKGKNSATITVYKERDVKLLIKAEGFLDYERVLKFSENVSSYNLTQDMSIDEAYVASEPGAQIANERTEFMVRNNMTREDAIKRMKYYIGEIFETYEVNDNYSGWYRTIWNVEQYPGGKFIRTRVEIKEVPDNGDGQLKFKFLLQSQITSKEHAKDEDYSNWDRVLKKYKKLAMDLRHIVE